MEKKDNPFIVGQPVLIVIDAQQMSYAPMRGSASDPRMEGYLDNANRLPSLIETARECNIPIIYFQEEHRKNMVDFGRELDGDEGPHCLEDHPGTPVAKEVGMTENDYFIRKRRYSCFFGTELEILLKGLKADTLIMAGGFTDVCVHYTFVDGHQHDYHCRVVGDACGGSSVAAHNASLIAMEYLQHKAVRECEDAKAEIKAWFASQSA